MTLREAVIELVRHRLEIVIKRSLSSIVDGHHDSVVSSFGEGDSIKNKSSLQIRIDQ